MGETWSWMLAVLAAHSSGLQGQRVMAVENSYAVRLQNQQAEIYMSSLSTRPLGCHMYILFSPYMHLQDWRASQHQQVACGETHRVSKGRCAPAQMLCPLAPLHGTCTITWQRTRVLYSTSTVRVIVAHRTSTVVVSYCARGFEQNAGRRRLLLL